jgi:hypothetical protein
MDTYWKRHELVESTMLRDPERQAPRDRWQRVHRRGTDGDGPDTPTDAPTTEDDA